MKLTPEALGRIAEAAEEIDYGRIVIEFNETMPDVQVRIELSERFPRGDLQERPGYPIAEKRVRRADS